MGKKKRRGMIKPGEKRAKAFRVEVLPSDVEAGELRMRIGLNIPPQAISLNLPTVEEFQEELRQRRETPLTVEALEEVVRQMREQSWADENPWSF